MAPHTPTPNVVRVSLYATLHGVDVETAVFFRRLSLPISLTNMGTLANRLGGEWNSFFRRQLSSELVCRELVVEDLSPGSSLSVTFNSWFGTSPAGIADPNSIAIGFRQQGPTIPRPWQFIIRWPGVPKSRTIGDTLDPTWAEGLRLGIRDRYTLQGAFGWRWCVVQKVVSGVPLAVGVPYDVTGLQLASPYVSPMRRRLTPP